MRAMSRLMRVVAARWWIAWARSQAFACVGMAAYAWLPSQTFQMLPCLRIAGLVVTECLDFCGVESGERRPVGRDHYGGLRVSERTDSFARVLVPSDVVHDVGDAVLVQFPFNGFTGHASGLGEQFGYGLVGVHGFFRVQESPAFRNVERGALVEHENGPGLVW